MTMIRIHDERIISIIIITVMIAMHIIIVMRISVVRIIHHLAAFR